MERRPGWRRLNGVDLLRRLSAVAAATSVLIISACSHPTAPTPRAPVDPLTVRSSGDARAAVQGGRFTRTLLADGATLRVDPPSAGRPELTEEQALSLARSAHGFSSTVLTGNAVADVVVGYGLASVALPSTSPEVPGFHNRPAWVVLESGPLLHCASVTQDESGGLPAPFDVLLLAADGSGEAAWYTTRGSTCLGRPTGPTLMSAVQETSVGWTVVEHSGGNLVLRAPVPRCTKATESGFGPGPAPEIGSTFYSTPGPTPNFGSEVYTLALYAYVVMAPDRCRSAARTVTKSFSLPQIGGATLPTSAMQPAPTGPSLAVHTDDGTLPAAYTYYDGLTHTLRP